MIDLHNKTTLIVAWTLADVEYQATCLELEANEQDEFIDGPKLFDRSKFGEVLELLEEEYDANWGITWESVGDALNRVARL